MKELLDDICDALDEFDGQLSYQEIGHMTFKELGYLRERRARILKKKPPKLF